MVVVPRCHTPKTTESCTYELWVSVPIPIMKSEFILHPLPRINNSSLKKGTFPGIWKIVRTAPTFQSGKLNDTNNFRPIPVLSAVSRVFGRIVHNQLQWYLKENRILIRSQHAFQTVYSTVTSLINSSEN